MLKTASAILVALLSALLLGSWVIHANNPLQDQHQGHFLLAGTQNGQDAATPENSFDQAARRWSRRAAIQPGFDLFISPAAIGRYQFPLLAELGPVDVPGLLGLSQGWQFHWRTALDPRAPSPVS